MSAERAVGSIAGIRSGRTDPPVSRRRVEVLEGQNEMLKLIARGATSERALNHLALVIEGLFDGTICVISVLDPEGKHLHPSMAPSLPDPCRLLAERIEIGPNAHPSGAAVFRHEPIIVEDVASDPMWPDFAGVILPLGLHACWSQPILDLDGKSLGVITLYFDRPKAPVADDYHIVDSIFPLALIAIEHDRRAQALRSADERFMSLAASLPGVVYQRLVTPDGDIRYTFISDGARDLFGVSPAQIIGDPQALFDCHAPEYRETFRERLLQASRDLTMWDVEAPIISRDGRRKWSHAIARPTRQPDGSVIWNGIILDATRIKMANLELAAANRAKSEFLANMSHELRTPLNAIIGFSEAILSEIFGKFANPRYREYVNDIFTSGTHLLQIINDILDLSKIEAGKMDLNEELIDPRQTIENSLNLIKEKAHANGIALSHDIAADVPQLHVDNRKFKQILINLVSNAVKFTLAGGRVVVRAKTASDGWLVVEVADTGPGIAPDQLEHVLDPFVQVDSGLDRKFEGTGLGLPLSRAMVEQHGGTLDLQSEVGKGTTVTLRFPPNRLSGIGKVTAAESRNRR